MKLNKTTTTAVGILFIMSVAGMGCKKKDLERIATVAAVAIAAKLLYDMYIEYKSEQKSDDDHVVNKYTAEHQSLPAKAQLVSYQSNIKPGEVVNPGNQISIVSNLEVVRGQDTEQVEIKERITIYDNEDNSKELKSLIKVVNKDTNKCGAFENEFTFTLPKGMPQGLYPIKTAVIINGVELTPVDSRMQLVDLSMPAPSSTIRTAVAK
ncbi:MAG: hypothetical protein OQJ89_11780 [Kangiellaceae bacterium]|nr:hypothetical protein [Kangiellaceae bacterium]MCW9017639.1 hypothetical protein [Kangiellaceae bacterium]